MYRDGEGKQNRTVAKEWLGKACDNGDKKGCLYYKKLARIKEYLIIWNI